MTDDLKRKIDPREAQRHLSDLVTRAEKLPDSLSRYELRLVTKYKKSADLAQQILKDLQDLDNQIKQGQARFRSMELQAENYQGTVNALVEELMDLKFDSEEPAAQAAPATETSPSTEAAVSGSNGSNGKHHGKLKNKNNTKKVASAAELPVKAAN